MRILMITDVYFPRINGVSTSIQTFRNDLRTLGHEVTLLAPQYGNDATDDAGILRVAGRSVPRDPEDRLMRRREIRRMIPEIARRQPELVHIHTPFVAHYAGIEIARALNVPVVTTYHTYFEHYFEHYVPFLPKRWLAALARKVTVGQCAAADLVISPSNAMLDALRTYGAQGRIAVLPTGLGDGCYTPGDGRRFRAAYGIAAERPIVLHVGRAAHEKNIDFLIRMLQPLKRAVPNVLMVIAGEGPALVHLKDLAQRMRRCRLSAVRWLPRAQLWAARLLRGWRRFRFLIAHGNPGSRTARGNGPRDTRRLQCGDGNSRCTGRRSRGAHPAARRGRVRRDDCASHRRSCAARADVGRCARTRARLVVANHGGTLVGSLPGVGRGAPTWRQQPSSASRCTRRGRFVSIPQDSRNSRQLDNKPALVTRLSHSNRTVHPEPRQRTLSDVHGGRSTDREVS